ncbi:hypothetical protein UlMin_006270 [Ulmus minor]
MLAFSPPLFPTIGWPLEDQTNHIEDQNYLYRNYSETATSDTAFLQFHSASGFPPSDQLPRVDHRHRDRSATPSTAISGEITHMVKKLKHNASERDRRKKINHLYSSLRSLLPQTDQTKKLSIPATVSRVLKYIPDLQQQVEGMIRKKEELSSKINSIQQGNLVHQENQIKNKARISLSSVSASQLNDKEVAIQISTYKQVKNLLSEILYNLEEDGLLLLNASSLESFEERIFHTLHLQVEGSYSVECGNLAEKLVSNLYERKGESLELE